MHQVSSVQFPRLKEVDDVLGGQAVWEYADITEGVVASTLDLLFGGERKGGRGGNSL